MTDFEKLTEIRRLLESLAPEFKDALAEQLLKGIDANKPTDDEGQLKLFVRSNNLGVRIDFGRKVAWIGLPRREAIQFAALILDHCGATVERVAAAPGDGQQGDLGGSNGHAPKA